MRFATSDKLAQYLDISGYSSDLVSSVLDWVDAHIAAYCRRSFDLATYRVWQEVENESSIFLPTYPILAVMEVALGSIPALSLKCGVPGAIYAQVSIYDGKMSISTSAASSRRSIVTLDLADYESIARLADDIMDKAEGWTAEALTEVESLALRPFVSGNAINGVSVAGPGRPIEVKSTGREYGILALPYPITGDVYICFDAGYAKTPPDLECVAIEMAATLLRASENDASLSSESLGDYRIQRLEASTLIRQFYPRLDHWKLIEV